MDGGIDRIYSERLGWHVQDHLREIIRRDWDGELPIGLALVLPTGASDIPFLIVAPTMRTPSASLRRSTPTLRSRAACGSFDGKTREQLSSIRSVACPGMGTGTGEMPDGICAKQMRAAGTRLRAASRSDPGGQ